MTSTKQSNSPTFSIGEFVERRHTTKREQREQFKDCGKIYATIGRFDDSRVYHKIGWRRGKSTLVNGARLKAVDYCPEVSW